MAGMISIRLAALIRLVRKLPIKADGRLNRNMWANDMLLPTRIHREFAGAAIPIYFLDRSVGDVAMIDEVVVANASNLIFISKAMNMR